MLPALLTTARLTLRLPDENDIDAITEACQDPEVARWITTMPNPYRREFAVSFIDMVKNDWAQGSHATWTIRNNDEFQGVIALNDNVSHDAGGSAEIGYWLATWGRKRGFLVEAGRSVVEWGFRELGLARIGWRAISGNIPSARSARALGFRYEGCARLGMTTPLGRKDAWFGGLLSTDDRAPVAWSILD